MKRPTNVGLVSYVPKNSPMQYEQAVRTGPDSIKNGLNRKPCCRSSTEPGSRLNLEIARAGPAGVFSRITQLRREEPHSVRLRRQAPMVVTEDPCGDAGRGR